MPKQFIQTFTPWVVYFALLLTPILPSLICGLSLLCLVMLAFKRLKQGSLVEWLSFIFFGGMMTFFFLKSNSWWNYHATLIGVVFWGVVCWGSITLHRPITRVYAHAMFPLALTSHPLYQRMHYVMTMMLGLYFFMFVVSGIYVDKVHFTTQVGVLWFVSTCIIYAISHFMIFRLQRGHLVTARTTAEEICEESASIAEDILPNSVSEKTMLVEPEIKAAISPWLSGNFAPVENEMNVDGLEIKGAIPKDLSGIYVRNGGNPTYPTEDFTYPFDGDGMLHAVYLCEGNASYRNRYVETKGYLAEKREGKALYGSLLQPFMHERGAIGEGDDPGPIKNGANLNVIPFGNKLLALGEASSAYEVDLALNTKGEWQVGSDIINVNSHVKYDAMTGDMFFFRYDLKPPYATCYMLDRYGTLQEKINITHDRPSFMHDFVLTEKHLVFIDAPAIFNMKALEKGKPWISWEPRKKTRIGVMTRRGDGQIKWIETDPFFVFHFANGFEDNEKIVIDYVRHAHFSPTEAMGSQTQPTLYRMTISTSQWKIKHEKLGDKPVEYPRINDDMTGFPHRYIYMATSTLKHASTYNAITKVDVEAKEETIHHFDADAEVSEAVFVPGRNAISEDDGYLLMYVYFRQSNQSRLVILDAQDVAGDPLASIILPERVPHGSHGSWVSVS